MSTVDESFDDEKEKTIQLQGMIGFCLKSKFWIVVIDIMLER